MARTSTFIESMRIMSMAIFKQDTDKAPLYCKRFTILYFCVEY
jgi:hypothetical protein